MQFLTSVYHCLCCISKPKFPDPYNFQFSGFDSLAQNKINFESNYVKTSKYTWYSFLPKSLMLQFKRLANIYFLFIAILQSIPIISPLLPVTAWIPLTVVLTVSIAREGYQDYQRYRSDQEMNHELKAQVRRNGKFEQVQWSQIVVGDICLVRENQLFPADAILFTSSIDGGNAFIQTASLDGQKNLKPRSAHRFTIKYADESLLNKLVGRWQGKLPSKQLHSFSSNMIIQNQIIVYEGDKQLLYRGSRLKNTKWVYGLVVYTGKNTKIMMNAQSHSQKMSQIEKKVNLILVFILLFQVMLCLTISISFGLFMQRNSVHLHNIHRNNFSTVGDAIFIYFSYVILINSMIPISLIVSMEIVKLFQSYFINKDNLMFSQYRNRGGRVKTTSLNEELGQIQYVFTDKTGTLTLNVMEFKIAVIGQKIYGDIEEQSKQLDPKSKQFHDQRLFKLVNNSIGDYQLSSPINLPSLTITTQKQLAQQYLFALSIAHQVICQPDKDNNPKYHGPSPDEITLVEAAKNMGFQFVRSNQAYTTVRIRGSDRQIQVLGVFPFNSDRKRMSILVRVNGNIRMYIKGADSIIQKRLSQSNKLNLDSQLNNFSKLGLRTLLIGMRTVSQQQYERFKRQLEKLPHVGRQKLYDKLVSELEQEFHLIGATAVLDRLQDFVPETIRDFIRARIKVWMLTGDKMETAQNIARSCNLFQRFFQILRLNIKQNQNPIEALKKLTIKASQLGQKHMKKGLLIQGSDLTTILESEQGRNELVSLVQHCQAVVCCRLLPSQKAELVALVRQKLNKITLAIGDGANDVPMIKAAHIGIGLYGQEGMSAVQASDYALPQFRMLWRLLFIHGRWNYIRISEMILYFFFKNMLFTIPQFILAFFTGFSGQSMYDDWFISFYNLIFTSVPLVIRAVLEQDVNYVVKKQGPTNAQISMTQIKKENHEPVLQRQIKYLPAGYGINVYFYKLFPKIYFIGQQNCIFNYSNFVSWVAEAIIEGVLISLFTIFILGGVSLNQSGFSNSLWLVGLTTYSCVICIVTLKICTHTKFFSKVFVLGVTLLSLALYLAYMWLSNYFFTNNIMGTTLVAWTTPKTYLTVLFCMCVVLFLDGIAVHLDYNRGGYASRMRQIIDQNKQQSKTVYDNMSLKITQVMSESPRKFTNTQQQIHKQL